MAGKSPTQNSLAVLRALGYTCWICEHWDHFKQRRIDLFNVGDILALRDGETLLVQTTTTGVSSRVKKIMDSPYLDAIRKAGWRIEVHGWRKAPKVRGGKVEVWKQRIVDLS